ncbi:hypothetical protein BC937DRAFT_92784 [Endogone sp. FLAS-F59071]|nr:hypothetical protein BC937DRAFT_92784 [Endogone sp. FLAS-F59071]|eukprot:RUS15184.1 hypothetical protein BC937DRAFT_92784 [Endogone sp. FLAS-F59071]
MRTLATILCANTELLNALFTNALTFDPQLKKEVEQSTAADPSMIDTTVTQKEIDLLGDIPSSPTSQPVLNPISLDFDLPEIPTGPLSEKKGKGKKVEEEKIDCTDFDELTKRFEALKKR